MNARTLLAELVAIDSTSSRPNAPIIDVLERKLAALGFKTQRHGYTDDAGVPKVNLVGRLGDGEPKLALVGHSDCVPFDPAWAEALTLTEKDGKLYARGAADTKAFIASALAALGSLELKALREPLAVVFTADEEVGCVGAKKLALEKLVSPRFAIVGEPTSLTPIRAHKGYALANVEVLGKEGHSAYPDTGASAILNAAQLLTRIEDLARSLQRERDDDFEPPYTTLNVGLISGGKAKNIIPGLCKFTLEWRPVPGQPVEYVLDVVKAAAKDVAERGGVHIDVQELRDDGGCNTPKDAELVRYLEELSGNKATTVPFGTEAPQLTQMGAQAVVFGPGDIRVAHRTGEFVPADELEKAVGMLATAVKHFCG